jgi:hypothetical protein
MTKKLEITTEVLPVPLTNQEILDRADRMGVIVSEIDRIDAELKAFRDLKKGERQRLDMELRQITGEIGSKAKLVEVEVKPVPNWKEGTIDFVRLDTGEVFRVRDMTPSERQKSFSVGGN